MSLNVLKKRENFLYVRDGKSWVTPTFVLQARKRENLIASVNKIQSKLIATCVDISPRFGFTASKKLGNAVKRNRAKRRLKEAVCQLGLDKGHKPSRVKYDYVLIARQGVLTVKFENLLKDLRKAFSHVHRLSS